MSVVIKFERVRDGKGKNVNFAVRIDGEHRATFIKCSYRAGYDLWDVYRHTHIASNNYRYSFVTQADFHNIVYDALSKGRVPTVAEQVLENARHEAILEDRRIDEERAEARRKLRCEVLVEALNGYLTTATEPEKAKVAYSLMREYQS